MPENVQSAAVSGRLPDLSSFDAVLFDLDGVLTPTADVHMRAWADLFGPYLQERGVAPYREQDYFDHIDGKQRYQGVTGLLRSRGIELPAGEPTDPPEADTVAGLGNRKDAKFRRVLEEEGVEPYPGSLALLERLEAAGTPVAVVSSSRNAPRVLAAAGLTERFPVVVDGGYAAAEGLASKPDPATYLRAAELLGVSAGRAVVVEDAISGVQAGQRGGFGLVVGVDRGAGRQALEAQGADVVVSDLAELVGAVKAPPLDRRRFPVDEWRLIDRERPDAEEVGLYETLFALGNGYLGMRGNDEENGPAYEHGTFINGFHETWPIRYPESAYAFAEVGQTILNLPDAKPVELEVDGEELDLETATLEEYERVLDMRAGTLERQLVWRTGGGNRVRVRSKRMVSFDEKHLALIGYEVTPLDADARVTLRSLILDRQEVGEAVGDAPVAEGFDPRQAEDMRGALRPVRQGVAGHEGEQPFLAHATRNSALGVVVMATHRLEKASGVSATPLVTTEPTRAEATYVVDAKQGESVRLEKFVAYHDGGATELEGLVERAAATLEAAAELGAAELEARQRRWLDAFWADADVRVAGQEAVQQAVRWNLFQLAQAAARVDGRGIAAKGVTGSGYSGHYFWDTEIYVLPYLIHTRPAAARGALEFRHSMLPAARRRARAMSEEGALFPWRTINGEEASAYYPAGTAQYHIDADIVYAVAKYVAATGDEEFLEGYGAEIAVETARMWSSLGFFDEAGAFHIHGVTGPDEYTAVVDDNFYTNLMAAFNLRFAADRLGGADGLSPAAHARLVEKLAVTAEERKRWLAAADAMTLLYDEEAGVHMQDARFLEREPWDIASIPREKRPLLLHFHPLVIYRHQVIKQVDLVLALYLHSRLFSLEEKRADFDFYDPLTTGDSTLSAAVQAIVAAEVGYPELAMAHFERMLYVDLADLHGNAADGVHVASAGGTWQALVAGFGGMREDGGTLRFDPRLPADWPELGFVVRTQGAKLRVRLEHGRATFLLEEGANASFEVRGRQVTISGPEPVVVEL